MASTPLQVPEFTYIPDNCTDSSLIAPTVVKTAGGGYVATPDLLPGTVVGWHHMCTCCRSLLSVSNDIGAAEIDYESQGLVPNH